MSLFGTMVSDQRPSARFGLRHNFGEKKLHLKTKIVKLTVFISIKFCITFKKINNLKKNTH